MLYGTNAIVSDILKNNQILFKTYNSCEDRIFNLHYYEVLSSSDHEPKSRIYFMNLKVGRGSLNRLPT